MYARRFYRQSPPPGYGGVAFSSPPAEDNTPAAPTVREEAPPGEPKKEQPVREEKTLSKGADTLRAVIGALGAALSPTKIPPAAKATAAASAPTGAFPAKTPVAPTPQAGGQQSESKLPPVFGRSRDSISSRIGERPRENGRDEFSPRGLKPASREEEAPRSDPGGLMADYIKRQQAVNAALAGTVQAGGGGGEYIPIGSGRAESDQREYGQSDSFPEEKAPPITSLPEESPLQATSARPDDTGRPDDIGRTEKISPLQSLFRSRFTFEELLLMGAALLLASGQADDEALLLFSLILILMGK